MNLVDTAPRSATSPTAALPVATAAGIEAWHVESPVVPLIALAFTFEGLVLASILYSLPFMVQPIASAFAQVDASLVEASSLLGGSRWRTCVRIIVPLSIDGVITGIVLSFAHTLGEFGVVLMVGGNLPGVTRTVSIAIYDQVQAFDYAAANATALLLLVFSFAVLAVVYALTRKPWSVAPRA